MAVTIPIPPTLYSATPHPIALLSEGVGESGCKLLPKSPRAQDLGIKDEGPLTTTDWTREGTGRGRAPAEGTWEGTCPPNPATG